VEENLIPGESVIYKAKRHWFALVTPCAVAIAGIVIVWLSYRSSGPVWAWLGIVGSLILLVGALATMTRFLAMQMFELALTSRRIMLKVGVLKRVTREILLAQVETIGVDQGAVARMVGYGKITIIGTGGTREPVTHVANPLEFRRNVLIELAK